MIDSSIDKSGYDKLDEGVQKLYKADGEGYQLQVRGLVPKSKLDEFRENNIGLSEQLKKYEKVDLDKYDSMVKREQKIADKKLIEAGDVETYAKNKYAPTISDLEAKNIALTERGDSYKTRYEAEVREHQIGGATSKAFNEHKIRHEMQEPLMAQINSMFTIRGDNVVAMDGDKIITGKDGNLTINEFVSSRPDAMKIPSSGGNGTGGGTGGGNANRTTMDKYKSGLMELSK